MSNEKWLEYLRLSETKCQCGHALADHAAAGPWVLCLISCDCTFEGRKPEVVERNSKHRHRPQQRRTPVLGTSQPPVKRVANNPFMRRD